MAAGSASRNCAYPGDRVIEIAETAERPREKRAIERRRCRSSRGGRAVGFGDRCDAVLDDVADSAKVTMPPVARAAI